MALPSTSGTVAQFPWDQRRIIDHAARRAGMQAQMESAENILVAQELLSGVLAEWVNAGFPLWTRVNALLGVTIGSPEVQTPTGTVDVIHTYWRTFSPYRGPATLSGGSDGATLFSGGAGADVTIAGPNPYVTVNFTSITELDSIGVLLGTTSSLTEALQVQTSTDGITYTTAQTLTSTSFTTGAWQYFDLDPSIMSQYVRLVCPISGSWVLQQLNFGLSNGTDIMLGVLNQDDYYNLPNKQWQGDRPVSCFIDRQVTVPAIKLWPAPDSAAFYNGCLYVLYRRYIQDPGAMTNAIEIPTRGVEALIWRLASRMIWELPDKADTQANMFSLQQKQQRMQMIEQNATRAEALFWSEERNKSPIRILPNIRPYTA